MADALYALVTSLMSAEVPTGVTLANSDAAYLDLGNANNYWVKNTIGSVSNSSAWSKFGNKSLRFNSGGALSRNNTSLASFGSGPFCIEGWLNADSTQPVNALFFAAYRVGTVGWGTDTMEITADPKGALSPRIALRVHNYSSTNILLQSTTNPLTAGALHFAISRDASNVWRLFVNGVLESSASWAGAVNDGISQQYAVLGGDPFTSSNGYLNGYLDDFRITIGDARYTSAFSVPTAAFEYVRTAQTRSDYPTRLVPNGGFPSQPITRQISPAGLVRMDTIFLGVGVVSGTVKEKASPANVPLVRKVLLLDESTNLIMRETWSEPITGNYAFTHLPLGRRYTVISYDYTLTYRAVVADNLEPALA